jgi:N-methylhydantoinase A/acetophenone carboxylase
MNAAIRDMRGEGFNSDQINFSLELELRCVSPYYTARIPSSRLHFESGRDVENIVKTLEATSTEKVSSNSQIILDALKVRAMGIVPHLELTTYPAGSASPEAALKGTRKVFWNDTYVDTPLYDQGKLLNGNIISGPVIIEGEYTTIVIPKGKKYSVDKFLFGKIENQ